MAASRCSLRSRSLAERLNVAEAVVVIDPGETSPQLNATGCENIECDFFDNCGANTFPCVHCQSNCDDFADNTANAGLFFNVVTPQVPGRVFVESSIYTDFEISATPETQGNLVPCSINYEAEWFGLWSMLGVFTGGTSMEVRVSFSLEDLNSGLPIKSELVHSLKPDGAGVDIFEVGGWINNDGRRDSFLAMLQRGHQYRLRLTLRLDSVVFGNIFYSLDYQTGGYGAWWNALTVSVAQDPEGVVAELRQELIELIENHTHSYLTGHGRGHNNTETITGLFIFPNGIGGDDEGGSGNAESEELGTPGDLDADGDVDATDLALLLGGWRPH